MSPNIIGSRSSGIIEEPRKPVHWEGDGDFKILSLNGGGMRGIFQSEVLRCIESDILAGEHVGSYFDMITGTSTGGIIALALSKRVLAKEISRFYQIEGSKIFPSTKIPFGRCFRKVSSISRQMYDESNLRSAVNKLFGDTLFGESENILCIPSGDYQYGDIFVFKTDHHPDFQKDFKKPMRTVAMATSAAPVYFRLLCDQEYYMVDGGLWANDPIMVGVAEAIASFNISRRNIKILSIGNSAGKFKLTKRMRNGGGFWSHRRLIDTIQDFQSQGARGQARLLIGEDSLFHIQPNLNEKAIEMDDYRVCMSKLPSDAMAVSARLSPSLVSTFFSQKSAPYIRYRGKMYT